MNKGYFNCVRDYLRKNSLAQLRKRHGVRYTIKGHLVTLAYDQFEAKRTNRIANNCRGAVIARADGSVSINENEPFGELQLLAFPLIRFFNYGEVNDYTLTPMQVTEKFDGTCIVFYFDPIANMWQVATRNCPDASIMAQGFFENGEQVSQRSFRNLFEYSISETSGGRFLTIEDFGNALDRDMTYVFELETPENQVVVHQSEYKVTLLAARSLITQMELFIDSAVSSDFTARTGIPAIQNLLGSFEPFVSFDDLAQKVVDAAELRDPTKHEGFVITGENFERVKVKSSLYVKHNRVHDLGYVDIVDLILTNNLDDFYALAQPQGKAKMKMVEGMFQNWIVRMNEAIQKVQWDKYPISDRKSFAEHVMNIPYLAPLRGQVFDAFGSGKALSEVNEIVSQMPASKVWKMIK